MKVLSLFTVLLAGFSLHAAAEGAQTEILRKVTINGEPTRYVGVLEIDQEKSELALSIYNDICGQFSPVLPGSMRCMAMAMAVTRFTVPIQGVANDCGSVVTSGMQDLSHLDGNRQEITVTDHSRRTCENVLPSLLTVHATVFSPRLNQTTTYDLQK